VIAQIREGHLSFRIPAQRYDRAGMKNFKNKTGLFGRMNYRLEDNRLFVIENKDSVQNIRPGTEILSINNEPVSKYVNRYSALITSDGKNKTFTKHYLSDAFFTLYLLDEGYKDSARIETSYQGQIQNITLNRQTKSEADLAKEKEAKKSSAEKNTNDYEALTDTYNRTFKFIDTDSTAAYMKIRTFSQLFSKRFYQQSFAKLKKSKAEYLVIDIRGNYGGSLSEINNLYSYLAPEPFTLVKPSKIVSKSTPFKTNFFANTSPIGYVIKGILYPGVLTAHLFSVKKDKNGNAFYNTKENKITQPKADAFRGKVFLLINGGSFSASSIIAAKMKYDRRATLVGEETGGANDGTVAGFYSFQKLPNSKLQLPIGLLLVQPNISFENKDLGVKPDLEIDETLENAIRKEDPVLDYVKAEIEILKDNKDGN
jgi:C-terminal processing protease CtpA/Prc